VMPSRPSAEVVEQFIRGSLWVAIGVMATWHVFVSLPFVVIVWADYGLIASGFLIWVAYAVMGAGSAFAALRGWPGGRWPGAVLPWTVCVLLLAGVLGNALTMRGGFFGINSFGFTSAGWIALVALWRRNLAELLAFFAALGVVGLIALILLGETSRPDLARFLVWCGNGVFQVTIYVGGRAVAAVAGRAAEAEDAAARTRNARLAAEAVQTARRARYEMIRTAVVPLLEGLADGTLDLTATGSRQEIAVAVTRLRRYLVENDDVPDPLSHELRACADAAERDGLAVDLIAPAGTIPMLGVAVRRALIEPVIRVLAAAATRARITVVASQAEVAVAILADARLTGPASGGPLGDGPVSDGPDGELPDKAETVRWDWDEEGDRLWAQAKWTRSSASLS
jgi:hypothetical protein